MVTVTFTHMTPACFTKPGAHGVSQHAFYLAATSWSLYQLCFLWKTEVHSVLNFLSPPYTLLQPPFYIAGSASQRLPLVQGNMGKQGVRYSDRFQFFRQRIFRSCFTFFQAILGLCSLPKATQADFSTWRHSEEENSQPLAPLLDT